MKKLNIDAKWLPDRSQLESLYNSYVTSFRNVLDDMEHVLKKLLVIPSVPTLKSRVKGFDSYYRKLLRILPESINSGDFPVITDNIGIRIVCPFLEDLSIVEKIIAAHFTVREVERKGAERTFREFGYESTHMLVEIPDEVKYKKKLPQGLICEIQIRTILQDAWAEVEHELVYKSDFSPFDLPLKRKLASINASLSLADIIFQEIRDYQNNLNKELGKRRDSFYGKIADQFGELSATPIADNSLYNQIQPSASPYVQGTIDDMILDAIHAHNNGDFKRATEIYTQIIDSKPNEVILSVMHKHRGMAYFSQSLYEKAKEDFIASGKYDPENHRPYYYIGIVQSVMNDHQGAVESFTKSLEKDKFKPYVYFRRAQSWCHLNDYAAAMSDLDKAVSLGLTGNEEAGLRSMLVKKMGLA